MTPADLDCLPAAVAGVARRNGWPDSAMLRWNACGVISNGDESTGWLTFAADGDVALITAVLVAEDHRREGLGRQLVQSAAGLLVRRDVKYLEAIGSYRFGPAGALPVAWLEKVGFTIVRPHPIRPRLRMELQNTVRWKSDLSAAWSRLTGMVNQPSSPEPATYAHREAAEPASVHP